MNKRLFTAVFLVIGAAQAQWLVGCSDGSESIGVYPGYNPYYHPQYGWGSYSGFYSGYSPNYPYGSGRSSGGYSGYKPPVAPPMTNERSRMGFEGVSAGDGTIEIYDASSGSYIYQ